MCNITFAVQNYIAVLPTADSVFLCGYVKILSNVFITCLNYSSSKVLVLLNIYSINSKIVHYNVGSLIYYHKFSPVVDVINYDNFPHNETNFVYIFSIAYSLYFNNYIAR